MVSRQKAYSHLRLAIADLTDDPKRPVYVGYRDQEQTFIASTAKLAILPSAFALRAAVRAAAGAITAKTEADFWKQLTKEWAGEFRRFNRGGKAKNTAPDLPRILFARRNKSTDPFTIDFTSKDGDVSVEKRGFSERMMSALKSSVNEAATSCIRDLGFPYIAGVLKTAGFFDKRGLWLSLEFGVGHRHWDPDFKGSGQAATARATVELLALIAQDRLIVPGLATEIRDVMATEDGGAGSNLARGIRDRLPPETVVNYQNKIGYFGDTFADAAILRRVSAKGRQLAYIAVAFGGTSDEEIQRAGNALDDCVLLAHGESVKPPANP
jgi:hypothetical protein